MPRAPFCRARLLMVLHKLKSRCKTCLSVPKRGCLQRWRVTWHGEREQRENRHGCANVQCWFCSWCCVCCEFTESTASFRNFCVNGSSGYTSKQSQTVSLRVGKHSTRIDGPVALAFVRASRCGAEDGVYN